MAPPPVSSSFLHGRGTGANMPILYFRDASRGKGRGKGCLELDLGFGAGDCDENDCRCLGGGHGLGAAVILVSWGVDLVRTRVVLRILEI